MVQSMQNIETEREDCIAVLEAFDEAKQLGRRRRHKRTVKSANVEFIRDTDGHFIIEAFHQDGDGDMVREWVVTHIDPTVITN